jgi:hypothetical protein
MAPACLKWNWTLTGIFSGLVQELKITGRDEFAGVLISNPYQSLTSNVFQNKKTVIVCYLKLRLICRWNLQDYPRKRMLYLEKLIGLYQNTILVFISKRR